MGFMDGLAGWLKQIVAVVLLAGLVDLLLPNRTMERYVRLVAGLLILLTMATPLLRWLQGDFSGKLESALGGLERNKAIAAAGMPGIEAEARRLSERRQDQAAVLLAARLEEAIRAEVEDSENRKVQSVAVQVEKEAGGTLTVKEVTVRLQMLRPVPAGEGSASSTPKPVARVEPVAPVIIGRPDVSAAASAATPGDEPDRGTRLRIAGLIEARYGIPSSRVSVLETGPADG